MNKSSRYVLLILNKFDKIKHRVFCDLQSGIVYGRPDLRLISDGDKVKVTLANGSDVDFKYNLTKVFKVASGSKLSEHLNSKHKPIEVVESD